MAPKTQNPLPLLSRPERNNPAPSEIHLHIIQSVSRERLLCTSLFVILLRLETHV